MPNPAAPIRPESAGDGRSPAATDAGASLLLTEERLQILWEKNRGFVTLLCALVALGIAAKYAWEYYTAKQEVGVQQAYLAASTVDQIKKFIVDHPNHVLAQTAELRLADQAYATGQMAEARDDYAHVAIFLKSGPLAARAQVGLGMTQIQSGETTEGEATLQRVADDPSQFEAARIEASYQLASLAAAAGRSNEVQKYTAQIMQLDPNSPWTQRAFVLESKTVAAPRPSAKQAIPSGK